MYKRHLQKKILKYSKEYPLLALVGPRQSGKTTLSKALFPKYKYVSFENIDVRNSAFEDPRGFLEDLGPKAILDEVQRVPDLFSYLQEIVDVNPEPGQYILTGSSHFLLIEKISQSLAGRIVTFKLYPLTFSELNNYSEDLNFESIYLKIYEKRKVISQQKLYEILWKGFYPRIYDRKLDSYKWYENYLFTYVERDVRSLLNVRNLKLFEQFLLLLASNSAQLINYTTFSNALGISIPTVKEWISLLETSGIIFILPPYFKNYSKRIIKTPKVYFVDTGLLCTLLRIRNVEQLKVHPQLGHIFETFIISECFKRFYNLGETPPLYFWRDQSQSEIDLIINYGSSSLPIEIKSSQTFNSNFKKNILSWMSLKDNQNDHGRIIYSGKNTLSKKGPISVVPWYFL
ncbi:MAG: hypothetical protein S4CHLAM7_01000 [Chlamydiae bacterium]|nr:hypothetical protein [Chlamydiota bacterium]